MVAEVAAEHPKPRPHGDRSGDPKPPRDMRKDVAALKNEQMSLL